MMKRLAVALSGLLLWSGAAIAQTTTLNPSDKDTTVTLSGGNLTASFSASWRLVRATVAKYHGKFCYQIHADNAPVNFSFGFASDVWPLDSSSGNGSIGDYLPTPALGGTFQQDQFINGVGYASNGIFAWWNIDRRVTGVPILIGNTAEACVDMDQGQNPPLVWITPDVTGTSGAAGGPLWNGSATSNPATGVDGKQVFLPKYAFIPAINGSSGDQITAKFTGFTPPAGFSTWNTAGGAALTPGPTSPLVINIANAPSWQPSHAYLLKDRVVAGPAWTGGTYADGSALCLFAVKTAGTSGSSYSSFNTACSSGTPASYGGGLDGSIPSQWTAATAVTDGGVTWALLSKVDYKDLTSAFADDAAEWAPLTGYAYNAVINKAKFAYVQRNSTPCTSGASWSGVAGTDGTCIWETYNPHHPTQVNYTSQTHRWPHFITDVNAPNYNYIHRGFDYNTNINIWHGGAQRPEYVAGANGESPTIVNRNHTLGFAQEEYSYCNKYGYLTPYDWIKFTNCFWLDPPATITTAAGDGIKDNPGPLRYDPTRGVALYSDSTEEGFGGLGPPPPANTALNQGDGARIITSGLQLRSLYGMAAAGGFGSRFYGNLMDAGGPMIYGGCCETLIGNVMISRSTADGAMGMFEKYHNPFNQNTIVGMGATHSTAFGPGIPGWNQASPIETIKNNLTFGFTYPFARNWDFDGIYNGDIVTWPSPQDNGGLAGDAAPPSVDVDFNNATHPYGYSGNWRTQNITGYNSTCGASNTSSCTGLNPADVFVNPTIGPNLDLRLKSGSVVLGAGVASDPRDGLPYDIFGTTRPQGIRYDPGAHQLATGGGSTPVVSLTASPTTITAGASSILTWTAANVSACTGTNFSTGGATSGSVSESPGSTITYSINCDSGAATATRTVTVNSLAPTAVLTPASTTITLGGTAVLGWTCTNSTSSLGSGFSTGGLLSGTAGVTPGSTATYGVTCTGSGGTATANSTVNVTVPSGAAAISTIKLCSTSGVDLAANTPSAPMFGLEFRKGDIPAGQYPQLQAQDGTPWPATFINKRSWSDGSMKIVGVLPGPFPKTITPACVTANVLNGGAAPVASGLTTTQLYNELMQVNANGFAGALGTALGLTGNWSAKLANDANNVEVVDYGDGGGGRVYRILTHVQQSGTPHGQMEVYWYVQQLKDASGGLAGYRVLPRLTQPWYNDSVTPAKDWRGLQTFNIQYGSGPTTITPPYPAADNPLTIAASNHISGNAFTATIPAAYNNCGSNSQQQCPFVGYLTADLGGSLPSPAVENTIYCMDKLALAEQVNIHSCSGQAFIDFTDAGTGTFTFHPINLLPHFGSLWGARADGRYTYIQGSGSVAADAPILIKGNPAYDQSTKLWPPWDLAITGTDSSNSTFFSGGPVQWDTMTVGPIDQNLGEGGERDEIGIRTGWCSRAFFNRALIDDKWVRLVGLVAKQLPDHVRDVTTRGLVNLGDPAASHTGMPASLATTFSWGAYNKTGFTLPLHGGPTIHGVGTDPTGTSHMPDFSGCAYMMTGEPQYLDQQMDAANQAVFDSQVGSMLPDRNARNPTISGTTYYAPRTFTTSNGARVMAWGMRPIVDVDAWLPDVSTDGTQAYQYFHAIERASTLLPTLTVGLDNSYAQTNCMWHPPNGAPRVVWMNNYMNSVMMNAYNAGEDPNGLWFLNCSATWINHLFDAYTPASKAGYLLVGSEDLAYDTGSTGSSGSLEFTGVNLTWSAGTATLTLQDPTKSRILYTGMRANMQGAYSNGGNLITVTKTSPTTGTFPLAVDPGGPSTGLFWPVGTPIDSDAQYAMHPVAAIGIYGAVWGAGTPGSIVPQYQVIDGVSWQPTDGDKIVFERNVPIFLGTAPGGLSLGTPYYFVNTHTGTNCGMSWAGGTLTVTTCAPHGMANGSLRTIGIVGADATGIPTYWGSYSNALANCQATDTTHFTCPVAVDPVVGTAFGIFTTANLAATPGGTALAMTDSGDTSTQSTGPGWLAANPPAGFSGDYPCPLCYMTVSRAAIYGMIATGVTGLDRAKAENDTRFNATLAYWGHTPNSWYKPHPKYAMTTAFGTGAPPPAPTPFVTLTATPNTISLGNSATLSWSGTAVSSCTGSGFSTGGAISGSASVSPTLTTAYGITCDSGAATANATVTVPTQVHRKGGRGGRGFR